MDTLTHALTGVVVARAVGEEKLGRWEMISGLAMGVFPDADFVLGLFNRQAYLEYHRDFTHSLLLIPLYALLFGWVLTRISKKPYLWSYVKVCLAVLISHVVLDLLTSYGTMVFSPFSDHRYSWDLLFIIDFIFSGIVVLSLLISLFFRKKAAWVCRGSLLALLFYLLFCRVQHQEAIGLARGFARDLKEEILDVASLPQPLSPFRWTNYVESKTSVYQGFVDLSIRERPDPLPSTFLFKRLDHLYDPPEQIRYQAWTKIPDSPWVQKALSAEGIRFYYWFARFPVVKSVTSDNRIHRVEFMDVRFLLPGLRLPFVYYVELDDSGRIRSEGFASDGKEKDLSTRS